MVILSPVKLAIRTDYHTWKREASTWQGVRRGYVETMLLRALPQGAPHTHPTHLPAPAPWEVEAKAWAISPVNLTLCTCCSIRARACRTGRDI